ncbi:hypothetical protein LX66_5581 [Chitinophaga japonensis]|uniref:Uncharacterized protein n=2 Tax=Chitinophaga japonensis TaxID=104662 RepID=A0A562SJG8_CHIJA|nr:hypothetical protein LX66_5581 [Chitinophaga japonensis]
MALLIISSSGIQGQTIKKLIEVSNRDSVQSGQGIIYGLFIQRLGFSSGGFPQDIRLINFDTKEVFSFRVKPTFKSARENIFVYHIPAGYYAILHYVWTQSKWYGGKMFTEPIYKGMAFSDIKRKAQAGQQTGGELKQFKFSVQPNTVNYVGTWNFDKEIVSFSDGKAKLDEELKVRHAMLNLKTAVVSIPD